MKRVTEKAKTRVIGRGSDPGVNHGPQVLLLLFSFLLPVSFSFCYSHLSVLSSSPLVLSYLFFRFFCR